jgi:hypothetical protein
MNGPALTPNQVHHARVSGESDAALARRWRVTTGCVRDARIGKSHRAHPTPPDTAPRAHRGNWALVSEAERVT